LDEPYDRHARCKSQRDSQKCGKNPADVGTQRNRLSAQGLPFKGRHRHETHNRLEHGPGCAEREDAADQHNRRHHMPADDGHGDQDDSGSGNDGGPVLRQSPRHESISGKTPGETTEKRGGNVSKRRRENDGHAAGEEARPQTRNENRWKVVFRLPSPYITIYMTTTHANAMAIARTRNKNAAFAIRSNPTSRYLWRTMSTKPLISGRPGTM